MKLLDFVKETGGSKLTGIEASCLEILQLIASRGCFSENNNIEELKSSVTELDNFINQNTTLKLWLPNLNLDVKIGIKPLELLVISGNLCKHNLSRLTGVSNIIHSILERHKYKIEKQEVPLVLENFRGHLQEDYFIYYGSWLSESLNNIRWGIQNYLIPIFNKSYKQKEDGLYYYEYPSQIEADIPKKWFWRLMII